MKDEEINKKKRRRRLKRQGKNINVLAHQAAMPKNFEFEANLVVKKPRQCMKKGVDLTR